MDTLWYFETIWSELRFTHGVVERICRLLTSDVFHGITSGPTPLLKECHLRELEDTLSQLRAAFSDMYKKIQIIMAEWVHEYVKSVRHIRNLRKVAYDIEDVLVVVATVHLENGVKASSDLPLALHASLPQHPPDLPSQLMDLGHSLADICDHLLTISDSKRRIYITRQISPPRLEEKATFIPPAFQLDATKEIVASSQRPRLWTEEDTVVGRESQKQQIINALFSSANGEHPIILTVHGDPGIGKTTLAKLVCNDVRVSTNFDLVLWVFCTKDLNSAMVEVIRSATQDSRFPTQNTPTELPKVRLRAILKGQKFLLVLDDFKLGYKCKSDWEMFREILEVGLTGSTVILVADSPFTIKDAMRTKTFVLAGLPEKESWSLFSRCALFDEKAKQEYPFLDQIGRSIVDKCGGCPLAIKTLGVRLRANRDELTWKQINESKLWHLRKNAASVALRLSIEKMSYELMQCFVASAILLEDKAMSRDQLVYFWMGLGLLQSSEGNEDLRDIGDMYCKELLSRGFLQLHCSDFPRRDVFQMHNQAHDLAKTLMLEERSIVGGQFVDMVRHLLWDRDQVSSDEEFPWDNLTKVRSFLFRNYIGPVSKHFLEGLVTNLRCARVILLDHSEFEELPETIGNLKLLRYLSLAGNHRLQVLPESLCNIVNLETLDVSGCEQLKTLPKDMQRFVSMRHLLLSMKLPSLPEEALNCLTSLHLFKICMSQNLNLLFEGISNLAALRVLWVHDCPSIVSLPSSMKFLANLKELSILNCQVLELIGWDGLVGLIGLEFLHLQGLPKLGNFPEGLQSASASLRYLVVNNCEILEALPDCLQEFDNLLEIVIDSCPNIVTLPRAIDAVKTLQTLKILNCPKLVPRYEPGKGEEWHLISHIPKIEVDHPVIQNSAASSCKEHRGESPRFSLPSPVGAQHSHEAPAELSTSSTQNGITTDLKEVWDGKGRARYKRRPWQSWLSWKLWQTMQASRPRSLPLPILDTGFAELYQSAADEELDKHSCKFAGQATSAADEAGYPNTRASSEMPHDSSKLRDGFRARWRWYRCLPTWRLWPPSPSSTAYEHRSTRREFPYSRISRPNTACALTPISTSREPSAVFFDEEGVDKHEAAAEKKAKWSKCSSTNGNSLRHQNKQKGINGDRPTPPLPPPLPPPRLSSSRYRPTPSSSTEVPENRNWDSDRDTEVEMEAVGDSENIQHEFQLIVSSEFESFSKGILFLLGQGYEFEKEKLIQLWMAGGFIQNEHMEINGAAYFEKLLSEGYILPLNSTSLYKGKSNLDMIKDNSSYLRLESESQYKFKAATAQVLHVSVVGDDMDYSILIKSPEKFNRLRTLLFIGTYSSRLEQMLLELFLNLESLLVLDLSGTDIKELPSSTGKMIHLRYLDLSWTVIELLPEAICGLAELQTLRLKGCSRLWRLPIDFNRLTKLRHLEFDVLGQLVVMPTGMGVLVHLRTLPAFPVGTQNGCKIIELRHLNNLTGEFCVAMLEHVQSADDAKKAALRAKKHLKKLELRWSDSPLQEKKNAGVDNNVLEGLRPHSNLEELHIQFYCGTEFPNWIADEAFQKLASVTLFKCEHVVVLPSVQMLPSLEYLRLFCLTSVTKMDFICETNGGTAFPKLRTFIVEKMHKLETWTEAKGGDFQCIFELTIRDCPELSDLPSLVYLRSTPLEFLMVEDCPLIKERCRQQGVQFSENLKHVRNVWIDQDDDSELLGDNDSELVGDDEYTFDSDDTEEIVQDGYALVSGSERTLSNSFIVVEGSKKDKDAPWTQACI